MEREIILTVPQKIHEKDAHDYYQEHLQAGESGLSGDAGLDHAESYDQWLLKIDDDLRKDIQSQIFFAMRQADQRLIGTINIRYPYEGYVRIYGHIGYGVRPSERRKGYATAMLHDALIRCKEIGLDQVLLTCNQSNAASQKTILKCNGIFESEAIMEDGTVLQRYWISLV